MAGPDLTPIDGGLKARSGWERGGGNTGNPDQQKSPQPTEEYEKKPSVVIRGPGHGKKWARN